MGFRKITRLDTNGLVIRDSSELTSFVNALRRIEAKPYNDKVPATEEDFECIRRQVTYESPNRLNVRQFDIRKSSSESLSYFVEF